MGPVPEQQKGNLRKVCRIFLITMGLMSSLLLVPACSFSSYTLHVFFSFDVASLAIYPYIHLHSANKPYVSVYADYAYVCL